MKKFLIVTLLLMALALPASAEQTAAEQYRQMFASGNFYVEYEVADYRDGKEFLVSDLIVHNISAQVPDEAFNIRKKFKLYAARNGDMSDLLDNPEQLGEIGGSAQ